MKIALRILSAVVMLLIAATSSISAAPHPRVAVLPLAAADTGLPYGLLPSGSELSIMMHQLRSALAASGVALVDEKAVSRATAAAGFVQTTPEHACAVEECARAIGRAVHADEVLFGSVTRQMAVVWGSSLSVVDVRSGKTVSEINAGYKGDVQAMELGERDAGVCVARVIRGEKPCRPDQGW